MPGADRGDDLAARVLAVLDSGDGEVVAEPPGAGEGFWAGAPSVVTDGATTWLAYRLRRPVDQGRGYANVVARSADGVSFDVVETLTSEQFRAASLERPALVPLEDGGLRCYVSCSTWNSKHWWVEALDLDADGRQGGASKVVLPGDAATAWKDVVVHRSHADWQMWACRHPLDGGDGEADRMTTWYATSTEGLSWDLHGPALEPTPERWDARGTRIASVLRCGRTWLAFYDGRATATENWHERTGVAVGDGPDRFTARGGPTRAGRTVRYLSLAEQPGGLRLYWEASRPDGAHELRTAYLTL